MFAARTGLILESPYSTFVLPIRRAVLEVDSSGDFKRFSRVQSAAYPAKELAQLIIPPALNAP